MIEKLKSEFDVRGFDRIEEVDGYGEIKLLGYDRREQTLVLYFNDGEFQRIEEYHLVSVKEIDEILSNRANIPDRTWSDPQSWIDGEDSNELEFF